MAGLTLALALAQRTSLSIAILEASQRAPHWSDAKYHHRVSAITLSSRRILQSLQIWEAIAAKRVSPFTKIRVWDASGTGQIHFDSAEIAEPVLGYIIENNLIQSLLQEKIKQYPQVAFYSPAALAALSETENGMLLTTADERQWKAKLVIAADGARSLVREQAGIELDSSDYQQEAIVATVRTTLPHQQTARQVFLTTGPLAFLPLAEANTSSIVWSLPREQACRLKTAPADEFRQELTQAFSCLQEIVDMDERYSFPLHKQQAKQYVKPRIALMGDAAHTIHPLAGQGVNMGMLDAASLAEIIVNAIRDHRDFANFSHLRRYERWRKADNLALMGGVDMIKQLFASEKKNIQALRSIGLNITERTRWIKNLFTRHAVGNRQGLPRMALD